MVISPAYRFSWVDFAKPEDYSLPKGQHYEWYANRLNEKSRPTPLPLPCMEGSDYQQDLQDSEGQEQGQDFQRTEDSAPSLQGRAGGESDEASSYTSLWAEDQFQARQITDLVQSTTQWGSLPGDMVELIKKAAEGKIDYRGALRTFRSSILSQKRRLTRMRPSRRFGFEQMGSHYDFTTRLLIAIDTSGSVGSEELGRYFRIITTFFKYGIQEIDVLMFDEEVQGEPITFTEAKKNKQKFKVHGRGGTNFQAPVNYVKEHPNYDGLIIITDGYAPTPEVPPFLRAKLLWVIDNEPSYKKHYESLRKTGRVCLMEL
jgi:predicted metal-dependent peptidase